MEHQDNISERNDELNENLQTFAHEIGIICALEAGGKIDSKQAYKQVKAKWKELKSKKKSLFPKIDTAI
ncbi:MAG: hypothetical protein HRU19_17525 [Pseudobacteriovorax sp.]|nr:hypothetical protein [Pseudobacteriovorax sp.]